MGHEFDITYKGAQFVQDARSWYLTARVRIPGDANYNDAPYEPFWSGYPYAENSTYNCIIDHVDFTIVWTWYGQETAYGSWLDGENIRGWNVLYVNPIVPWRSNILDGAPYGAAEHVSAARLDLTINNFSREKIHLNAEDWAGTWPDYETLQAPELRLILLGLNLDENGGYRYTNISGNESVATPTLSGVRQSYDAKKFVQGYLANRGKQAFALTLQGAGVIDPNEVAEIDLFFMIALWKATSDYSLAWVDGQVAGWVEAEHMTYDGISFSNGVVQPDPDEIVIPDWFDVPDAFAPGGIR